MAAHALVEAPPAAPPRSWAVWYRDCEELRMLFGLSNNKRWAVRKAKPLILFLLLSVMAVAADYQGQNVDRTKYLGFARSLATGNYYPASAVFERDHANVRLESGKKLDLVLDQATIEDPEEILAVDGSGVWWALSIDGLDEPADAAPVTSLAENTGPKRSR